MLLGSADGLTLDTTPFAHGGDGMEYAVFGIGDVNGDGYDDVAVSTRDATVDGEAMEGRVTIHYGSATGVRKKHDLLLESPDLGSGAWFGTEIVTPGDIDGDGYDDVVISAPLYDDAVTDDGILYVFFGGPSGLPSSPSDEIANPDPVPGTYYGFHLGSRSDVDRDGYADVLVGQSFHKAEAMGPTRGVVYLYQGGPNRSFGAVRSLEPEVPDDGSQFGDFVVFGGDMDHDGTPELVVGEPLFDLGETREVGRSHIYEAPPFDGSGSPPTNVAISEDGEALSRFGQAISSRCDLNGDGYSDLAVGSRLTNGDVNDRGAVFIYMGGAGRLDASPLGSPDETISPTGTPYREFGTRIARY